MYGLLVAPNMNLLSGRMLFIRHSYLFRDWRQGASVQNIVVGGVGRVDGGLE
jgi:hypothetical protein